MNKYEFRDKIFELQQCPIDIKHRVKLATELLNEYEPLKERETPKKISTYDFKCECGGNCRRYDYYGTTLEKFNFCPNCGQALDWSDNNE